MTARAWAGQSVQILRDLDLDLRSGEILGVVGESGSGKSTLCRAIARLLPGGLAVDAAPSGWEKPDGCPKIRAGQLHRMPSGGVRMVFQNPMTALNPVMTVGDQCTEAARAGRRITRAQALARSVEMLERMGIRNAARRMNDCRQFSGGQRQRIVVSIALAGQPVLLADEPTSALDVSTQAALLELIQEVCAERQTAVIFVSHNYAVVSQLCSRVLVLYAGQAMELGPSRALLTQSRHPYTAALIACGPPSSTGCPGCLPSPGSPRPSARLPAAARSGCAAATPTTAAPRHLCRCARPPPGIRRRVCGPA